LLNKPNPAKRHIREAHATGPVSLHLLVVLRPPQQTVPMV
jgi:hypothetical protein